MSDWPTISIVIPVFNQAAFLGDALRSVLNQTRTDWEAIVVDDASTDATPDVVAVFNDPRIRSFRNTENQERSRTRNIGIQMARGEFIAFLDADDFWMPQFLEKHYELLALHPEVGLSFSAYYDTTPDGRPIRLKQYEKAGIQDRAEFLKAMLIANRIQTGTVLLRASVLQTAGVFDASLRQGEDWDLWLRVAMAFPVAAIEEPLMFYRRRNDFMPARLVKREIEKAYPIIVERAFSRLNDPRFEFLRLIALAQMYWLNAWVQMALENIAPAQLYLNTAKQYDPSFFAPPYTAFIQSVGYLADELYDLATPVGEAIVCVNRLFDNLPDSVEDLRKLRKAVLGQVCGVAMFGAYRRGDAQGVREAIGPAIRNKPAWLLNRGFISIIVKAYRGQLPSNAQLS